MTMIDTIRWIASPSERLTTLQRLWKRSLAAKRLFKSTTAASVREQQLFYWDWTIADINLSILYNEFCHIRNTDLRRVKAEDFRSSEAFFAGEMTTRKANAPSQTV
jgi:hypothetical protein